MISQQGAALQWIGIKGGVKKGSAEATQIVGCSMLVAGFDVASIASSCSVETGDRVNGGDQVGGSSRRIR